MLLSACASPVVRRHVMPRSSSGENDEGSAKTVSDSCGEARFVSLDTARSSKSKAFHQLIVGVSANSDADTMQAAFAAGIDAFMAKPFTLKTFNETYNRWKAVC